MAKFSLSYVKQNPVMFGAIFVVFGLGLWLMMNRGAGGGSTQVVQTGPSEGMQMAALQAGAAIQAKQIEAATATAMGAMQLEALSRQLDQAQAITILEAQYRTVELAANERMSDKALGASLEALQAQLQTSLATTEANNQFMVDYATVAADSATTQLAIGAALQRSLAADQLEAFKYSADTSLKGQALSMISSLKKKNRDEALTAITAMQAGVPNPYVAQRGGFDLGDIIQIASPVAGAIA